MTLYEDKQWVRACVSTALKRHRRTQRFKDAALTIVAYTAAVVPWLSDIVARLSEVPWLSDVVPRLSEAPRLSDVVRFSEFLRSNIVALYVGILVVLFYRYTERRLMTMQLRLATMHDLLHRIAGDSAEAELLLELVSEVGTVDPDPKL
jgi:hypothetical protein